MTAAYLSRMVCLCLAAFFLLHLVFGLAAAVVAPAAIRRAPRLASRTAARWLLILRLAPAALALFVVAGLCVPSYLWLEPYGDPESVGVACLVSAALGLWILCSAVVAAVRAARQSRRYIEGCRCVGLAIRIRGCRLPVWMVEGAGSLTLAGVVRPRIFISPQVLEALPAEQLDAALRHEGAHAASLDNLKRLLLLAAPGVLPFFRGFDSLESHWMRFAEWAADDRAVEGDAARSISLAGALVRVARLAPAAFPVPAVTSLLGQGQELAARVDRLLRGESQARVPSGTRTGNVAAILMGGMTVALLLQPTTFHCVHRLLEELVH